MHSLNHGLGNGSQWEFYKKLELLADSTPDPVQTNFKMTLGLSFLWRSLLSVLVDELVDEQRVDYLERCWAAQDASERTPTRRPWQQFLTLIE